MNVPQINHLAIPVLKGQMGLALDFFRFLGWQEHHLAEGQPSNVGYVSPRYLPPCLKLVEVENLGSVGLGSVGAFIPYVRVGLVVDGHEEKARQIAAWAFKHDVRGGWGYTSNREAVIVTLPDIFLVQFELQSSQMFATMPAGSVAEREPVPA